MIIDFNDMLSINSLISYCNTNGLDIGLTSGCWDLTHYYHLRYWERCKRHCDILVVGVNDDELIRSEKNNLNRPIFHEGHRLRLVEHSKYVDATFLMHTALELQKMANMLQPKYLFKNDAFIDMDKKDIYGLVKDTKLVIIRDVEEKTSTTGFIASIMNNKSDIEMDTTCL